MSYGTPPPSGSDPHEPHESDPTAPGSYGSAPPPPPPSYGAPDQPSYGQQPPPSYGSPASPPPSYGAPSDQPAYGAPGPYPGAQGGVAGPAYGAAPQPPSGYVAQAHSGLIDIPGLGSAKIATVGQRFLARLIDSIIIGVVFGVIYALGAGALMSTTTTDQYGNAVPSGFGVSAFFGLIGISLIITLLYEVVLIALKGQTLGKMAMGVKVVRSVDGQVPGWGPSLIRWVIPAAASFVCGLAQLLVYISVLFDNSGRQQGWHDKAANDVVISTK